MEQEDYDIHLLLCSKPVSAPQLAQKQRCEKKPRCQYAVSLAVKKGAPIRWNGKGSRGGASAESQENAQSRLFGDPNEIAANAPTTGQEYRSFKGHHGSTFRRLNARLCVGRRAVNTS
jgi:hypothetical protein